MSRKWRCFHCDEVFSRVEEAREHFGTDELRDPACKIASSEHGLVGYIRDLEAQIAAYRSETDPISTAWHAMRADYAQNLIREEERGYNRGVRDMIAQGYLAEPASKGDEQ